MSNRPGYPPSQATEAASVFKGEDTPSVDRALQNPLISLLERLPDAVLLLDSEWCITFANAEARRISRLTDADLKSKTHWELYPETVGTVVERTYREAMRSRQDANLEYHYTPFDVWLDIRILAVADGLALHYRDISDRKRAELARDATMSKLEQVLEASTDSIVCIDRDWNCTLANAAARAILKSDDLIGANLWTRFPGNNEEPFASNYRATMEQRIPTEFEAYYAEPLDIWFRVYARPFEDGIIIFSNDITDRKRAEAGRDATTGRLNQVLEATTDAVILFDRKWTYTFLNQRAMNLLQRDDLLGKKLWDEFPAAPDSDAYMLFPRCMDEGVPAEFDDYYPEPLNRWFTVQCRPSDDGIAVFFRDTTERRAAEQVFREQRELITFVQQAARTAFWKMDLATQALNFDVGSYPVFGYPLAKLTDCDAFLAIVHPDDRAQIAAKTANALETGELVVNDFRVLDEAGTTIWLEARSQVEMVDGKPATLGGMTIDITERKRAEQALAASEERYRVLTELSPQFVWTGSPDGEITYANQGFMDYLGFTAADIGGAGWLNAFHAEDRQWVLERWMRSVATGETYEIEARLVEGKTGEARWWWLRALPLRDPAGAIVNWLGVSVDIHDRKTAVDALSQKQLETERQRAELETLYRTAPIGLALFDPVEFRYLRLNDRQAEIVGLPPEQVLGKRLTEIAPIPGLNEMFQQVADGVPIRNALLEGTVAARPDEHRFWNVNYFPVYNADGTVRAITAASMEITNQKRTERALIESEKLAAVGRLAQSISHEINNPLEAVTNLLYLIEHDPSLPASLNPLVEMAQGELQRVCQIATQTLRFHRQAVKATRVTAQELVGAVLTLYQGRLANSGIRVDARYDTQEKVLCLENDIRQVLNNLIANAIDAMRHGGRLVVRAHDVTERKLGTPGRAGIRITVADTGHGMSVAVRERIFEPFYTTKALNGTGLGLWISNGIVERHHGEIRVRSSDDPRYRGTVFSLFLPHQTEIEISEGAGESQ
jgi:PAS domain S-box-containing protein